MYRIILLISFFISIFAVTVSAQSAFDMSFQQAKEAYLQGDYSNAVTYSEQALKNDSLRLQAYIIRGSSHLALQQPVLAEQAVDEGLHHFAKASQLKWLKAEALVQQNRVDQAFPVYEELYHENDKNVKPDRDQVLQRLGRLHLAKGNSAFQQNELIKAEQNFKKVLEIMPDSLHSYHNLALVYLQQEKWQEALKVTMKGLAKFPGNSDLLRMRANALYRTEDYKGVLEQYRKLYNKNPGDLEIALQFARLLMASGDIQEAYFIYDKLLKKQPENREVYESLAEVYEQRNDTEALRSLLRKMKEQFSNDESILERIAHTYEFEENWQKAREVYDLLNIAKPDPSLELAIAETWEQQDSLQTALEVYTAAVNRYPKHVELLRRKGRTEEKLDLYSTAKITYNDLLMMHKSGNHHIRLGRVLEALEKDKAALTHYQKAIRSETEDPFPYYRTAKILMKGEDMERSFQHALEALDYALKKVAEQQKILAATLQQTNIFNMKESELHGQDLKEYNRMVEAIFYFLTDNFSGEKIHPLLRDLERDYTSSGQMLYLLSTYYESSGDRKKQISLLRQASDLDPDLGEAHLALGEFYKEQGQIVSAIQAYEKALSTNPARPDAYDALIQSYRDIEKLDSLIERWMARYRVRPESEVLRDHLIEALHKAGRYEEARRIVSP